MLYCILSSRDTHFLSNRKKPIQNKQTLKCDLVYLLVLYCAHYSIEMVTSDLTAHSLPSKMANLTCFYGSKAPPPLQKHILKYTYWLTDLSSIKKFCKKNATPWATCGSSEHVRVLFCDSSSRVLLLVPLGHVNVWSSAAINTQWNKIIETIAS